MIIFLCVCEDRSAAWRLWNHKTHHRIAGWWTPALFPFLASLSRKMWISFLGRLDWRVPHHWYMSVFPPNFSFESAVERPSYMSAYVVNSRFNLLRIKFTYGFIYIKWSLFSLKCTILTRSYDKHAVRINYNRLHSSWGTLRCKSVTQWERIQYHEVNDRILRLMLWR